MTSEILFGPDLAYEEAASADFTASWTSDTDAVTTEEGCESNPDLDGNSDDNNMILHENENDETGRMGQSNGQFEFSFILNASVDDESDDYEESESNSDDEHIERNVDDDLDYDYDYDYQHCERFIILKNIKTNNTTYTMDDIIYTISSIIGSSSQMMSHLVYHRYYCDCSRRTPPYIHATCRFYLLPVHVGCCFCCCQNCFFILIR
jgi:hypothetical protein